MTSKESIFISYRRTDSQDVVGRIDDYLSRHFGREHVFLDRNSIDYGDAFPNRLKQAIQDSKVVLVVIGSTWLSVKDTQGRPRIESPDDWVRQEIALALALGLYVIPILLDGTVMPDPAALPEDIQALAARNAIDLMTRRSASVFTALMKEITDLIERKVPALKPALTPVASNLPISSASASLPKSQPPAPTNQPNQPPASVVLARRQLLKWAIPAGVGMVGVTVASQFLGHQSPQLSTSSQASSSATTVDYSKLEGFLRAGQWKEADDETNTLMLKAANREKAGALDEASIQNFPCEVLSKIDRLWVDSSGGKFGFSVQKKIYESCGGKANGEFEPSPFDCFTERVGWRAKDQWIDDSNVIFNAQAPQGHLPYGLGRALNYAIFWGFLQLFSRTAACKL